MCRLCNPKTPQAACPTRRGFLTTAAIGGAAAVAGAGFAQPAMAQSDSKTPNAAGNMPEGLGTPGRRVLLKGGAVLSMDDAVGNFPVGDVLIDGAKIVEVGANIDAPDAVIVDAKGKIVMPGFVDTHHHQFETALRSQLSNGILINDGRPANEHNYFDTILQKFSMVYRPEDVYINELYGSIAQLDAGVTTVMDVSQIHHSPSLAISKAGARRPNIPVMLHASSSNISPPMINC